LTLTPGEAKLAAMNPLLDLLLTRRSVTAKAMTGPGPDEATLRTILTAAIRVPDHGKLGPWRFILIRGEARARLGEILAQAYKAANPDADEPALDYERRRFSRAPVVVGVVSRAAPHVKIPEWEQQLSAGAVCQNMLVAAHAAGFGAQWLTEWYSYDGNVARALGLGEHERMAGFVYIGRPIEPPKDRVRPALPDVLSEWQPPA
jgi:nitroreductase